MKKILYLMGIDWYWIKQRPQIIAEMLSKDYDITVAYLKETVVRIDLRKNKDELQNSISIPVIPYRDKSKIIHYIQKIIFKHLVKNIDEYDIIWIGHPLLYRYISEFYKGKIVYDCMDNHIALCSDFRIKKKIYEVEETLLEKADLIFASSNSLKEKIGKTNKRNVVLVRNGFEYGIIHKVCELPKNSSVKVGYFGTIAEWIDFNAIIRCLDEIEGLEFYFWGPVSIRTIPHHDKLFFNGVVEHHQLWDVVKEMDCLIMPFIVNDIIKDVDPVKLYEYISMGKIIIAPYYKEIERFELYAYFYHCHEELLDLLKSLQKHELKCKYSELQQKQFMEDNSWEKRYEVIKNSLLEIDKEENCKMQ